MKTGTPIRRYPTNPSTGIKHLPTGSTARKRLSRATAPSKDGPFGAIKHGVVISSPLRANRASAMGQTSRCAPAITTLCERVVLSSSLSASERGTTLSVAPVSTRSSTSSTRPLGPVKRPLTWNSPISKTCSTTQLLCAANIQGQCFTTPVTTGAPDRPCE